MKHKLRKTAWALAILSVTLGALIYIAHIRSKSPLEEYKAKLRASGEKLAIEELIPPRVPVAENRAEHLRKAIQLSEVAGRFVNDNLPFAMRTIAPGKAIDGSRQPDIRTDTATNSWEAMDAALLGRNEELELLHELIEQPVLDFELEYKRGFRLLLPHLAKTKGEAQLLFAAAVCDLHRGNTPSSVTNIRAILAIVKGTQGERLVISQLVRIAIASIAVAPTWELLQATNATDSDLQALQKDWQALEFTAAAEASMEMERAMALVAAAEMRAASNPLDIYGYSPSGSSSSSSGSGDWLEDLGQTIKDSWSGAKSKTAITLWRVSWSYTDELRLLQGEQILIESFRQLQTNKNFRLVREEQNRKLDALGIHEITGMARVFQMLDESELTHLASSSVDSLQVYVLREMRIEAARQLIATAIALKRFHLAHQAYPDELSQLVPQYLAEAPLDPVDNLPLRYHKNSDGTFLLYSVGEDGVDDGGDAVPVKTSNSFSWDRGRDWVWPQPASEAEIQAYYATNSSKLR